jgi:hypothetical protein
MPTKTGVPSPDELVLKRLVQAIRKGYVARTAYECDLLNTNVRSEYSSYQEAIEKGF